MEGEGEASSTGQTGILGAPPGADRGGEQRGALGQVLLLVPEAQEARGLVTQQEVGLAIAKVKFPSMAVPVEAEVVEAPGVGEGSGGQGNAGDGGEGGMDREGILRVLDGDVQV